MRILILRTSALGDIVHALPVLNALRRHLEDAKIAWVVEEAFAPLLSTYPGLDAVISIRARDWRHRVTHAATRREIGATLRAMRAFHPDIALDLMGNYKAAVLARLSGASRRVGFDRRSRRERSSAMWINQPVSPRGLHAVDRMLSLLDALSLPREPADFGGDRLLAGATTDADLRSGSPFALIHPGAGWGNKRYPASWWGEVA
ncbi:MAG TPA: glycosyltransferase family 9 protein, partial [Thermoanaerobaculia bacterium]|nr:glycosyltransferase family 9 protein [Thermoanaerobaculia bacterium]